MDKKYLNSALIVLLIVIWGGIIYKYFGKSKVVAQKRPFINANTPVNHVISKDTFTLKLNNRDPFKTSKIKRAVSNTTSSKKKSKKTSVSKVVVWPKIQYFGFVKSEANKTKLALVKVNGKLYKKREKDKIEALTILRAYSDSIIVAFNKNLKTIKRL